MSVVNCLLKMNTPWITNYSDEDSDGKIILKIKRTKRVQRLEKLIEKYYK